MTHKWASGANGHVAVEIDPTKYIKGKGTRVYNNGRQCAAVYKNGGRAGLRCSWYAQEGRIYCKKHGTGKGSTRTSEHVAALRNGARNWWARMQAIEREQPGFLREFMGTAKGQETRRKRKVARTMVAPLVSKDPIVARAHKTIVRTVADLLPVADKPESEMSPAEVLVKNTITSLNRMTELLALPIQDEDGVIDYKAASLVKDTALRACTLQVKVDRNAMAAQKIDRMHELLQRLKAGEQAPVIEG